MSNYQQEINVDEVRKIKEEGIRAIHIGPDTATITLKVPKYNIEDISRIKKSYTANLNVNGETCKYEKYELTEQKPKTSQCNISDSCFFLTFEISPFFQKKGEKTGISVFLITDSVPTQGRIYRFNNIEFDEKNPIVEWISGMGDMAFAQISFFPKAEDVLPKEYMTEYNMDKRIILSECSTAGSLEILSVKNDVNNCLRQIELLVNLKTELKYDNFSYPLEILNGRIHLYQIEKANIKPLIFKIDYAWPEVFIPKDNFQ